MAHRDNKKSNVKNNSFNYKSLQKKTSVHKKHQPSNEIVSNDPVRINKALADAGVCSRRKAEELILAGSVLVNGNVVTELGHKVLPQDIICVNGQEILRGEKRCYLMMNKPVQTMCTAYDPENRTTIFEILPEPWKNKRLFSVGRLDYFSEGLLILTDDGELAQKLSHPSRHFTKTYRVLVREEVSQAMLKTMQTGMTLTEGDKLAPIQVHVVRAPKPDVNTTLLEMTLSQGVNRQIRRMCRDLGLTIFKLIRIAQGPLQLADLEAGKVRELNDNELKKLRLNKS